MSGKLRDYLLGDALYGPVGGGFLRGSGSPQLIIGALLLRRRRLSLLRDSLEAAAQAQLDAALDHHDTIQREWTLHYEKKLRQEASSRLKLLAAFIRDCGERPRDCAGAYPVEAMRRTITQEIMLAMDEFAYDKGESLSEAGRIDAGLRRHFNAGEFIWDPRLASVYLRAMFWWLYGKPADS